MSNSSNTYFSSQKGEQGIGKEWSDQPPKGNIKACGFTSVVRYEVGSSGLLWPSSYVMVFVFYMASPWVAYNLVCSFFLMKFHVPGISKSLEFSFGLAFNLMALSIHCYVRGDLWRIHDTYCLACLDFKNSNESFCGQCFLNFLFLHPAWHG